MTTEISLQELLLHPELLDIGNTKTEELVNLRMAAKEYVGVYEAVRKQMDEELMSRLEAKKIDGEMVGSFSIAKRIRLVVKTTLEKAKEFGAVKEAVDTQKLLKLSKDGIAIPDIEPVVYLDVREVKNKNDEA